MRCVQRKISSRKMSKKIMYIVEMGEKEVYNMSKLLDEMILFVTKMRLKIIIWGNKNEWAQIHRKICTKL